MGVRNFGGAGLMPAMSNEHTSSGSPLNVSVDMIGDMPMDKLLDISDLSETFKNDTRKCKSVLGDEVRRVSENSPLSGLDDEGCVNKMQGDDISLRSAHELSTSLPNLNVSIDTDSIHTMNEVDINIRNSLSDIFSKPDKFGFSRGTLCPGKNGSLSELKAHESMHDDGSLVNPQENGQHLCPAQETNPNGKHVSAVLQSIPPKIIQVNLPGTKGIEVAVKQDSLGGCDGDGLSDNQSYERTPTVITGNISSASGGSAQCVALRTPAGRTNVDTDDSQPSATLSQESDVSNRSSCQTVVDVEQERMSSTMTESQQNDSYDDSCIDETTTFDVRRSDIMSNDHCCDRLSKADASSFSSISSLGTGTDLSASANSCSDDIGDSLEAAADFPDDRFVDINLHPGNTYERSKTLGSEDSGFDEKQMHQFDTKPKRRGITDFLTRGFFSRKPKAQPEDIPCDSGLLGWKFFGRVPPKQTSSLKKAEQISREFLEKQKPSPTPSIASSTSSASIRKGDVEVLSTTALILEQRPRGLPSKSPEEEEKHRQQYQAMIEAAKRKEAKDVKQRKKQVEQQLKHEDELSAALAVWRNEILPNWETTKSCKKTRDLWWNGVPPSVRGQVWKLAIGNELNLTPELYEICLLRAKDKLKLLKETSGDTDSITSVESAVSKESSVELIKLDVSRTFPQLCIFQKGGPYHELLQSLLGAYVCYRPDVGYVQGMSFIAAVLLLNMDVADAFICFANLLNRPCTIAFFRLDESLVKCYFDTYELLFAENLPVLYNHFEKQKVTADLYIIDWMFTLYARSLPLDIASRAWDVFFRDGEEFLFRMALGILKMYEDILLNLDFIHLAQFLTRLPETMNADELFHSIDTIHMTVDKRPFQRVLLDCKDREMC